MIHAGDEIVIETVIWLWTRLRFTAKITVVDWENKEFNATAAHCSLWSTFLPHFAISFSHPDRLKAFRDGKAGDVISVKEDELPWIWGIF